ncbi:hypothetical protein ACIRSS_42245 [Amycolatopsis sp. NPDC101161]|uniref:hypothetical protein n=1 Tax=Amycolatopsis sp. NPDC101161 TaxID=3363940 RepID=UPI0038043979
MPKQGEPATNVVDLSRISLAKLRYSDDPALLRSLDLVAGRTECGRSAVLQNQAPYRTDRPVMLETMPSPALSRRACRL